jgi:hypothetical protein
MYRLIIVIVLVVLASIMAPLTCFASVGVAPFYTWTTEKAEPAGSVSMTLTLSQVEVKTNEASTVQLIIKRSLFNRLLKINGGKVEGLQFNGQLIEENFEREIILQEHGGEYRFPDDHEVRLFAARALARGEEPDFSMMAESLRAAWAFMDFPDLSPSPSFEQDKTLKQERQARILAFCKQISIISGGKYTLQKAPKDQFPGWDGHEVGFFYLRCNIKEGNSPPNRPEKLVIGLMRDPIRFVGDRAIGGKPWDPHPRDL